jgi:hypothetical protein
MRRAGSVGRAVLRSRGWVELRRGAGLFLGFPSDGRALPAGARIREIFFHLPTLSKLRGNHLLSYYTILDFNFLVLLYNTVPTIQYYDLGIARSFLQLLPSAGLYAVGSRQIDNGPRDHQHEISQVSLCGIRGMIVVSVARHTDSSLYVQEKSFSWCCIVRVLFSALNSCQENLTFCL